MTYDFKEEMSKLIDICNSNIKNSKEILTYLSDRNINDEQIKKYKLGFFPQNVKMLKKYVSEEFMKDHFILSKNDYCDFSERYYLIIPMFNEYGEPVAIMGRTLLDEFSRKALELPKYKNSSYQKAATLYGLNKSRASILKNKSVYVVEGNFDTISMQKNGIDNAVGICGTAFSKKHFLMLAKYTNSINFILDNEDVGFLAMQRIRDKFEGKGVALNFYKLPDGIKDPDEYFRKYGNENFLSNIEIYSPDLEW